MERESDSNLFKYIFRLINAVLTATDHFDATKFTDGDHDHEDTNMASEDEFMRYAQQELQIASELASEPADSSKLEASRVFAEFATDPQYFDVMVLFVSVLISLLMSPCHLARQHTMMTLSALSEHPGCLAAIRETKDVNIFAILMSYASNGPYYTAKMRRESMRLLKNLADKYAPEIITNVGKNNVKLWMENVKGLTDLRMKETCDFLANSVFAPLCI